VPSCWGGRFSSRKVAKFGILSYKKQGILLSTGMADSEKHELTNLLRAWSEGDQEALHQLTPRVYKELHRLARIYMAGERLNHSLQTTALINEAYVRLIGWKEPHWQSRTHFFAVAAQLMRRVLVDAARKRGRAKRGAGIADTTFEEAYVYEPAKARDLVALDEALTQLEEIDPRKSRIVELRFFAGLSLEESALVMQLSSRTVRREWNVARAWLRLQLNRPAI
jgi:RNA polymerase sigma-70 factor, ECF subfamily